MIQNPWSGYQLHYTDSIYSSTKFTPNELTFNQSNERNEVQILENVNKLFNTKQNKV